MRKFKWGILGPGKIAGKFAEDLSQVENAVLYAVGSRSQSRAEEFARKFGGVETYGSYEDLVKDDQVDIVYIATPHVFHFENTMLCLMHGKPVLCEKPFAMNLGQVDQMIQMAQEKKVFLMEALWTHFLPHYNFLLDQVHSGKYGEVLELKADFGFAAPLEPEKRLYNKDLGGGSLMDIGIYTVFAALTIMGVPEEISARAEFCSTGVDEDCKMELSYKNGRVAKLYSVINKTIPTTAVITLEKAQILVKNRFHEPSSIIIKQEGKEEEFKFDVNTRGYNYEAEHVQQMLLENRIESTVMTFEKSRNLIKMLDEIRKIIGLDYMI